MDTRRLGRTGHQSSVAVLGAAAFWNSDPEETARCFEVAIAGGVNHLDIAPSYGQAERLIGPLVPAVRSQLFVGCKTGRSHPDGVQAQLENSLRLLGCDHFDLYQSHGVTSIADLDGRAGAFEAILAARDTGLTRFAGITGHGLEAPRAHAEALRRYDLDTVMFPLNPVLWADPAYRADAEALLELAAHRDVGVMIIKSCARRQWAADAERYAGTWYEPHTARADIERGVRFVLSIPGVHAFCTPGDPAVLALALDAAADFEPIDVEAVGPATVDEAVVFPMPR